MSEDTSKPFEGETTHNPDENGPLSRILSQEPDGVPDLTQLVMNQIAADLSEPRPCEYDFEFASAYFDNALSADIADPVLLKHRIYAFEKHLPQCPPCNRHLGLLLELTDAIRGYFYRQETRLERWDASARILSLFSEEQQKAAALLDEASALPAAGCGEFGALTFSMAADRELAAPEQDALNHHLSACPPCQAALESMTTLSGQIRAACESVPAIPDLWPAVSRDLTETRKVVPMKTGGKKHLIPMGLSAAAAAMLLFVFVGNPMMAPKNESLANKPIDVQALKAAMVADEIDQARRLQTVNTAPVVSVNYYQTPEDFLFSREGDLPDEEIPFPLDVSSYALGER